MTGWSSTNWASITCFIDEAHYFKNLETPTKMERVAGIQTGGSERAFDLYMKCRYLDEQHPGHGVTFATGTPISNTMVEMFTMQRFLDPAGLQEPRASSISTPGPPPSAKSSTRWRFPLTVRAETAQPLRPLHQSAGTSADVPRLRRRADGRRCSNLPRPRLEGGKPIVVACPMSEEQQALQQELVKRYERLRSQKVDPRDGQRPGHHHRRPQARHSTPGCSRRRPRTLPGRRSTPWSRTSPPSGSGPPRTAARR